MSIRISNAETEQLIREMAVLEQVTPAQAVHKAVSLWLSELNLTSQEGRVVEAIVKRRVLIAHMDGQDWESRSIYSDVMSASVFLTFYLIMGLVFSSMRLGMLILVIIVSIVSIYFYNRRQERAIEKRAKQREELHKQIAKTRKEVPGELQFLADGPTFMDIDLSSEEGEEN
jgi:hypothetical protein